MFERRGFRYRKIVELNLNYALNNRERIFRYAQNIRLRLLRTEE